MAIDKGSKRSVQEKESIARVEIFCDAHLAQDDWTVVFHFETGDYDDSGNLTTRGRFGSSRVERRFGDIKGEKKILGLTSDIKEAGYRWLGENEKREAAARKIREENDAAEAASRNKSQE